jgi:hypothetical protein
MKVTQSISRNIVIFYLSYIPISLWLYNFLVLGDQALLGFISRDAVKKIKYNIKINKIHPTPVFVAILQNFFR